MKRLTPQLVLATTMILAVASLSSANHTLKTLRVGFDDTCRQLRFERDATLKQARADHFVTKKQLQYAERDARRLCEPERSCALAKIRHDRRDAAKAHRHLMAGIRTSYAVAIRQAKASYVVACREVRTVVETLPCGCAVNACTCPPAAHVPPAPYNQCNECDWPIPHSPVFHEVTTLAPEVFRVQTTRRVVVRPGLEVCPPPVLANPWAVASGLPRYDDRPVVAPQRPISYLLRSLLASL